SEENLGRFLVDHGGLREAEGLFRESLAQRQTLGGTKTDQANSLLGLGRALARTGRAAEAVTLLSQCVGLVRATYPASGFRLAVAEREYGASLEAAGKKDEGRALMQGACERLRAMLGDGHWRTQQAAALLQAVR